MLRKLGLFILAPYLLSSCSLPKEAFMPFRNMVYSGQSLQLFKNTMLIGSYEYGLTMALQLIG